MTTYILPFEKMHGLGNDFIMLEKRHLPNGINLSKLAKVLCDRHFGIGGDGIIVVDISATQNADFEWEYINSDGSEAEMCGNGMRCFAKYVFERGFTDKTTFIVKTKAGNIIPTIEADALVTVNMGIPKLPDIVVQELTINNEMIKYTYIETGNPHCVIFVDQKFSDSEFNQLGPLIEAHKNFPNKTNVEFVRVLSKNELIVKVWERGCGPTLACATGAGASLVAACINNYTDTSAKVHLPGGILNVRWDKGSNCVSFNGPATFVYFGQYNLDPKNVCK